jgi:hypothetical protein
VVIDPQTGALDEAATDELRSELGRAFEEIAESLGPVDRGGYELMPSAAR